MHFLLQVIVMEISQNLAPKIVLSRTSMIERPAAFQMLPFMELSDPDAGWSNVTVTLLVQPSNPQLQAPMSSFKYKRWSPWDMPQATVRTLDHANVLTISRGLIICFTGCQHPSCRLSWLRLPES